MYDSRFVDMRLGDGAPLALGVHSYSHVAVTRIHLLSRLLQDRPLVEIAVLGNLVKSSRDFKSPGFVVVSSLIVIIHRSRQCIYS